MKINNSISFKQSFVNPTLQNLSKGNQAKVAHSFPFGQLYPIDIEFGGTLLGNLVIYIKRCNLLDYFAINDSIPVTNNNVIMYLISKKLENISNILCGQKYKVEKHIIKDLDNKSAREIAYEIDDKIAEYNKKYGKTFIN